MPARSSRLLRRSLAGATVLVAAAATGVLLARSDDPQPDALPEVRATHSATPARRSAGAGSPPASAAPSAASMPVVRGAAARRTAVPILMYHVLGTPAAGTSLPDLWVSRTRFREQLAALRRAGYEAVTLRAVFGAWTAGGPLPRKPVVLSFDDGYLSHATVAAPAMRRYGWPGVVNVTTHNLGPDGLPRHLAQKLAKDGWEIDSHTVTHPDLRTISASQLRRELTESRRQLRALTGTTPQFFCYPAGKFDARVKAAVRAAGYQGATTVEPGVARRSDDPFELPRVRVTNADTGGALVRRLAGS